MRFTCTQQSLNRALGIVLRAVSSRTTIPILKGILFRVEGDTLTLSSSNLDLSIETKIKVQDSEDGAYVIGAKLISEIVRRLPNAMITMSSDERDNLKLVCLGSEFLIVTMPAEEYPSIGFTDGGKRCKVSIKALADLVQKTSFAASVDEKKGILTGCLVRFYGSYIEMAAIDGFRMAIANTEADSGITGDIVIPAGILNDISRLIQEADGAEEVDIKIDEKRVEFSFEETRITARQLEGVFMAYRDILPKEYKTRFIINREELLSSIERASLFAKEGKNNLIKINVSGGMINISSRSEEGNVSESISAEVEGDDILIGFNSKYISDVLKAVTDEDVAFEMTGRESSCLIKPADGEKYIYLVLPVRMTA